MFERIGSAHGGARNVLATRRFDVAGGVSRAEIQTEVRLKPLQDIVLLQRFIVGVDYLFVAAPLPAPPTLL